MRIIITLSPNLKKILERRNRQSKTAKTPLPKRPQTRPRNTRRCVDVNPWANALLAWSYKSAS